MPSKFKTITKNLFYFILACVVLTLSLYFAGVFPSGIMIEPGSTQNKNLPVQGDKFTVVEEDIPMMYSTVGTIHSRDEIEISARITAKITDVLHREGDIVKKGEVLVSLDDLDLKANLANAKENLNKMQAVLTLKEKELARNKSMYQKEAIAKRILEQAESAYDEAKAGLLSATEAVKAAEANLSYAFVLSPMDAIVSNRYLDPGDLALPGLKIMEVFDNNRLMLYVPISESMISKIKLGDLMSFYIESVGKNFTGEVKEIAHAIEPLSRTFRVKICLGKAKELVPGMFGRLSFQIGTEKVILIAEKALIRNGQLEYVMKIDSDGSAIKVLIRTTPSELQGKLKVISGLKPGDIILN